MILLIDNYDSFVHNLARYVRELGGEALVRRNDALTLDGVAALAPSPSAIGLTATEQPFGLDALLDAYGALVGEECRSDR